MYFYQIEPYPPTGRVLASGTASNEGQCREQLVHELVSRGHHPALVREAVYSSEPGLRKDFMNGLRVTLLFGPR